MPGEILGIAGIGGSGKVELAETIAGLRRANAGVVSVDGVPLGPGVGAALKAGIGYVPRDRHAEGLIPELSIEENVTLTIVDRLGRFGWIDRRRQHAEGAAAVALYGIVARDARQPVAELSGGNQQKVVFARALARDPNVVVAIDPTAGVDVTAKAALHAQLARQAEAGKAIVVVSDDLEDLRACGRVLVLLRGRVVAELAAGWNDTDLIARMEGIEVA
jgi:simple sugar transport system ATP-binding protein